MPDYCSQCFTFSAVVNIENVTSWKQNPKLSNRTVVSSSDAMKVQLLTHISG